MLPKPPRRQLGLLSKEISRGLAPRTVAVSGSLAQPGGSVKKSFCKDRIAILRVPHVASLEPGY